MNLDMSRFKKLSEEKKSATFLHPDGHKILIAKHVLSSKMQKELSKMPIHHYAEGGGPVASVDPSLTSDADQMETDAGSTNTTGAAPSLDRVHELYNQYAEKGKNIPQALSAVAGPLAGLVGEGVKAFSNSGESFGPNGEEPKDFNPAAWERAKQETGAETQKVLLDNKARQEAGVSPLPLPNGMQAAPIMANTNGAPSNNTGGQTLPLDPYQNLYGQMMQAPNEMMAGNLNQAKAEAALGQNQAAIQQNYQAQQQQMMDLYNNHLQDANQHIDDSIKDYQNGFIKPQQYMQNMGTGQKIRTGIGLMLGSIGGALTHTENPVLKMLNDNITRDVNAQMANQNARQNILSANFDKYKNMDSATKMTQAMQWGLVNSQLMEQAAKSQSPLAMAKAQQLNGQIKAQYINPLLQQVAQRQMMMQLAGSTQGGSEAASALRLKFMAPEKEQPELMKQLQTAENMVKARDNLLSGFDVANQNNTVLNRAAHLGFTPHITSAAIEPGLAQLVKDSEGRITPTDVGMMKGLFPAPGDMPSTVAFSRQKLQQFIDQKMNFPGLTLYGIHPLQNSRYGATGNKPTLGPAVSR